MKSREQQLRDYKVDEKKWEQAIDLITAEEKLRKLLLFDLRDITDPLVEEASKDVLSCLKKYNRYARI